MTGDQFDEVERICLEALEQAPDRRTAFLDAACGDDADLRAQVERLVAGASNAEQFLETPPAEPVAPALRDGDRLGPYEVVARIGAGGMGEVYRARDTRLGRDVALKVLSRGFAAVPLRRARFEREARAIAALNHPHICALHDVGRDRNLDFLVMEHVEGETLANRLEKGPLPIGPALAMAVEIAGALAAAHRHGIVHRDLKPANVMVTREGAVKVLDFGLAKLVAADDSPATNPVPGSEPPSLSRAGIVAGTPAYMSPEQATGGTVDARSDVFSFGALLYEMVTGRRAFPGRSGEEVLRAIMAQPVNPPSELKSPPPPALVQLIQRCLKKDPARRFQHMDDVRVELQEIAEESNSLPAVGSTSPARTHRWSSLAAGAALVLVVAAVTIFVYVRRQGSWTSTPSGSPRLTQLTTYAGMESYPSFSPDGSYVTFAWTGEDGGKNDIYVKAVDGTTASPTRLTTNPADDTVPSWSPDGRSIAFCRTMTPSDGAPYFDVMLVPALGGPERRIGSVALGTRPALSWTPDGQWIATPDTDPSGVGGIFLLPVRQGERRRLTSNPRYMDAWPAVSPDGRWLAYGACSGVWTCDVHVQSLGPDYQPNGEPRALTTGGFSTKGISWTADGEEVVYAASRYGGNGALYLWRTALSPGSEPRRIELANRGAIHPTVSRVGHLLAFTLTRSEAHLWRIVGNESPRPLTDSTKYESCPDLSPDSKRLVFSSNRASEQAELFVSDWDGANPVRITDRLGREQSSPRWSPDGQRIVFDSQTERGDWDLFVIDASGGVPRLVSSTPSTEGLGSWSRDGRFIYFNSDRSGRPEIWRVLASGGPEVQVTDAGGVIGLEAYDGRTLYYVKTRTSPQPLFARTLGTAGERKVVDGLISRTFAVDEKGVFYFAEGPRPGTSSLRHVDGATGEIREVAQLDVLPFLGLSASRDGKMIFFSGGRGPEADLYVIDNFR